MLDNVAFSDVTMTARAVYLAIHVQARDHGFWDISQAGLAEALKLSERDIRRRLAELQAHGFVRLKRGRIYLEWAFQQDKDGRLPDSEPAKDGRLNRPMVAASGSRIKSLGIQGLQDERSYTRCACGEPHDGPEPRRCPCGRVHRPEAHISESALDASVEMLHAFVRQAGLNWPEPDVEIASAILEAVGGAAALHRGLKHLMLERRARPSQSYGWFLAVFTSRAREATA